ncbi:hypothetical protein GGX14DRAFT_391054 [Mycena pura]|uniref:DUF6729 domain-containing protein n=1 Tax=Mycena pura TaxID=153505 RepID=A0AAD6VQI9_9AGAR|nr:hypothetical protein GGX14DRAFT_391054 [Mycena pura]
MAVVEIVAVSQPEHHDSTKQETEASVPQNESILKAYLGDALARIQKEIKRHGQPLCYARGDLFDRPPHPLFAVRDATKHGFKPDVFCHMDIFLWLPLLLPGAPDAFKCDCGHALPLVKKGWNPEVARRVKSFPRDYFLLMNRLRCPADRVSDPGCGKTFQGTDPHIIAQLPRFTQMVFPAFLSTCGALDKLVVSMMSCTFATRFGPAPCSELFTELQYKHHDQVELIYLDGARHYQKNVTPFSAFADCLGWAGAPPSVQYLKAMFVDWASANRVYWERGIASLPGTVIKADHTFDVTKYMGGLRGEKIHTAAHTMNNEFEEIRKHALVPSKAYDFLEDSFTELDKGLKEHGHPPISVLYTDSPQTEYGFLEKLIPSLAENVSHITKWTDLPPFSCEPSVNKVFTSDTLKIEDLCADILAKVQPGSGLSVVALAVHYETTATSSNISAIQLRTQDQNLVFDVCNSIHVSSTLPTFTASSPDNTDNNQNWLWSSTGAVHTCNCLHDEVEAIWQTYRKLAPRDSVGLPLSSEEARQDGRLVTVVHGNKAVAEGVIIGQHAGFLKVRQPAIGNKAAYDQVINVTPSRTLVSITKVITPNSIHRLHAQPIQYINEHHGGKMVVTATMLRTRGSTAPIQSTAREYAFSVPADAASLNVDPIDFSDVGSESCEILLGSDNNEDEEFLIRTVEDAQDIMRAAADCGQSIPTRVGTYNRSGRKYRGHFDTELIDSLYEIAIELGVKLSFTPPPVLTTRIATSESFAIRPISLSLAEKYNITCLPTRRVDGVPYHHDIPVHALTRLYTKPTNRYRSLQLSQRTLHCVAPVHTHAEYSKFRNIINDSQFRKSKTKVYAAHEAYRNVNYELLAIAWNSDVDKQSRTKTDSNKCIYYKFPCQLEHHHKKVLLSKSQRATLLMGSNADALQPFFNLLTNTEPGTAPAALDVPEGAIDTSLSLSDFKNLDLTVLDTLNLMCPHDAAPIPTSSTTTELLAMSLNSLNMVIDPSEYIGNSSAVQLGRPLTMQVSEPTPTPVAASQQATLVTEQSTALLSIGPSSTSLPDSDPSKRRGNRSQCHSADAAHNIPASKKCRWSEEKILKEIARREAARAMCEWQRGARCFAMCACAARGMRLRQQLVVAGGERWKKRRQAASGERQVMGTRDA